MGVISIQYLNHLGLLLPSNVILVATYPGAIALTVIFLEANSFAIDFVKPIIPAFEAA